ncbi:MAG: bifunctional NADH dehydrogenase FAD-containing subunit/selenide, water dikinase SelD, partial [Pseudomonadota bacterium]
GAEALAARGIRSSLYTENRAAVAVQGLADTPCHDLLFDPQTGGGLLAAVPGDGDAECARLRDAGFAAVVIGQTTDTGLIEVV